MSHRSGGGGGALAAEWPVSTSAIEPDRRPTDSVGSMHGAGAATPSIRAQLPRPEEWSKMRSSPDFGCRESNGISWFSRVWLRIQAPSHLKF